MSMIEEKTLLQVITQLQQYEVLLSSVTICASAVKRLHKTVDRLERLNKLERKYPMPLPVQTRVCGVGSM